jgi:tetratricopeptide (TPR) repeat protein
MTADEQPDEPALEFELERLEHLFSNGQRTEVIQVCTDLLRHFPEEGRLYYQRAQARRILGDKVAALDDITRAREKMPGEPAVPFFRGLWCLELGTYAEGVRELGHAIALDEDLQSSYYASDARFLRALGHALLGEFELATQDLTGLSPDASFYVAGKLWTLSALAACAANRRRPLL